MFIVQKIQSNLFALCYSDRTFSKCMQLPLLGSLTTKCKTNQEITWSPAWNLHIYYDPPIFLLTFSRFPMNNFFFWEEVTSIHKENSKLRDVQ